MSNSRSLSAPLPRPSATEPWVDWGKAVAAQLIVWHHLVSYGPLARRFDHDTTEWLVTYPPLLVQVFLVISGYLGARSLWPQPGEPRLRLADWPRRVAQRWGRLMPVYLLALVAAVAAAAVARYLMRDVDTPAAPTLRQGLAHLLMLQDILEVPALTTGVWYVAIDLQLFALFAGLAALMALAVPKATSASNRARPSVWLATGGVLLLSVGALAAVCGFNLLPDADQWGTYFFGSFALGVLAAWGWRGGERWAWMALIMAIAGAGLVLAWRDRLALAAAVALLLLWQPGRERLSRAALQPVVAWLAARSYAVFLLHYPVSLLVNSVFERWLPRTDELAVLGLGLTWALSLAAADWAHRVLESKASPRRRRYALSPAPNA